jgi:endonuclease YncB( thermonuclease family)
MNAQPRYPTTTAIVAMAAWGVVCAWMAFALLMVAGCRTPECMAADAPRSYGDVTAQVVRVHDGDTLIVNVPEWPAIIGESIGVRLAAVDAPELESRDPTVKAWATEARAYVASCCPRGTSVKLCNIRRDDYFRVLASVNIPEIIGVRGGRDLSQMLLREGYAKPYNGGAKQPWTAADCHHPSKPTE